MTTKVKVPVYSNEISVEQYLLEVECWEAITNVAKPKRALALVLEIPNAKIKHQILESVTTTNLSK